MKFSKAIIYATFMLISSMVYADKAVSHYDSYTPTRIEWLANVANAICHHHPTTGEVWTLGVVPEYDDTLVIFVSYSKQLTRYPKTINIAIEYCHNVINILFKRFEWQDWVKIRDEIKVNE